MEYKKSIVRVPKVKNLEMNENAILADIYGRLVDMKMVLNAAISDLDLIKLTGPTEVASFARKEKVAKYRNEMKNVKNEIYQLASIFEGFKNNPESLND